MNKYFVLFCIPTADMDQWSKDVSPDERKKQMESMMQGWQTWQEKYKAAIVDNGGPLGKTKRVTHTGVVDMRNDLNYYIVLQANSHDEATKMVAENPHVQLIPASYVDVMEIPHMGV